MITASKTRWQSGKTDFPKRAERTHQHPSGSDHTRLWERDMADLDRDHQIKILQAQVKALLVALNEVRAKCDLAIIQIPKAAK